MYIGYDASCDESSEHIAEARDTASEHAVMCLDRRWKSHQHDTLYSFAPIYTPGSVDYTIEGRRKNLMGYILGMFYVDKLVNNAFKSLPEKLMSFTITSPVHKEVKQIIFKHEAQATQLASLVHYWPTWIMLDTTMKFEDDIVFAEETWHIICEAGQDFIAAHSSLMPPLVLMIGLIITFSLFFFMRMYFNRAQVVEHEVTVRTKELAEANAALGNEIIKRKQTQSELEVAKQEAESASVAKSRFLANMSHEIRTPMNAVIGFAELLQSTEMNDEQKNYLGTIKESGSLLIALINDILDISKIEAEQIDFEEIDFSLECLIEGIIKIISSKVKTDKVELMMEYDHHIPAYLRGDPTRIRQIVLNLLGNAVKFTSSGEIVIEVNDITADDSSSEKSIQINVRDTGAGIPKDKQKIIFEAFTQADSSTTRKYGGTGLGLAISRKLSQMMGGGISLNSNEGKGSVFTVTLRLQESTNKELKDVVPVSYAEIVDKTALIVDDNTSSQVIVKRYCEDASMKILHVCSGVDEALAWLNTTQQLPDFILSDVMMPEKDGYTFMCEVRAQKKYDRIKAVAITSDVYQGASKKVAEAGFNGFLPKPIMRGDFIQLLRTLVGDSRDDKKIVTRHVAQEVSLNGVAVLVVDDNEVNLNLIEIILKKFGCNVTRATNGKQAIQLMQANTFNIVLMDIEMPIMDGVETTNMIRKSLNNMTPVIALTAAALKEDREKALGSGMNDFITKPIDVTKLRAKVVQWAR